MVPSRGENIEYLVTFGNQAPKGWGDDDYTQVFFFLVPKNVREAVYIRVYDPDVGGDIDQQNQGWNTRMKYSVYGGRGTHSDPDARKVDPVGNYRSGILLDSKTFGSEPDYNKKWYTFGPFNPTEGELDNSLGGYIFKLIIQGTSGNDGNLYKLFLSTDMEENRRVEGGNGFTYEYSFRLSKTGVAAQLYPYIDQEVIALKQNNFDFDNDGYIKLYSVNKNGHLMTTSNDNQWTQSSHKVSPGERGKSMNIQIIKTKNFDNDMELYVTNQYAQPVPFFAVPIG
ncbi:MAG: hypothetical protein ACFB10_08385, partial [Salibacteraceae bacterium]